jgi:tight adherence protein B
MTGPLAALAGAALSGGLILVAIGLRPTASYDNRAPAAWNRWSRRIPRAGWSAWRWPAAGTALLVGWVLSGWPVVGLIVAVTVVGLPVLLGTSRQAARSIDRIEAVEEWTRRLADVLVVGVGLEQAIAVTARTSPEPVRAEIHALAARLSARWPTETALRSFAADLDDATGDLVAAALILAARRRGPGLARALTAVADAVAEQVRMRRRVEADRAKPRTTARAVTVITLVVVGVGALNGAYVHPYGTAVGQLVLAGTAAGFVAALAWMRALTLSPPPPRFLTEPAQPRSRGAR